ncbi:MAG: hypothetical protein ABIP43_00450 [Nitrospiraceae bacterium]
MIALAGMDVAASPVVPVTKLSTATATSIHRVGQDHITFLLNG